MESNKVVRKTQNVRIYVCGGGATNIVRDMSHVSLDQELYGNTDYCFIDTSRSDSVGLDKGKVYLIDGIDGSGQKRSENAHLIMGVIPDVLTKFPTKDFNIVIHTASGGSGNVIGSLLTKELLLRKQAVVVIMIGDSTSTVFAQNTVNTIKTYDHISREIKTPVVACYFENLDQNEIKSVDGYVTNTIRDLAMLFSGHNNGLDKKDLQNFLNYTNLTQNLPARLTSMIINGDENEIINHYGESILSVTLSSDPELTEIKSKVIAKFQGINPKLDHTLHYTLNLLLFPDVVKSIEEGIQVDLAKIRSLEDVSLATDAVDEGTGLVF